MEDSPSSPSLPSPQEFKRKPLKPRRDTAQSTLTTKSLPKEASGTRKSPHRWFSVLRGWDFEICFILLSVGAMIAVAGMLHHFNQAPTAEWHFVVSLNAVVSILVTTAKASMMLSLAACLSQEKWEFFSTTHRLDKLDVFDDASRGPLGSIRLLWIIHRSSIPAFFGAVLTLLSLTMEPFAQQVIEIAPYPIQTSNEKAAHISYIQKSYNMSLNLNAAVVNGVIGNDSFPPYYCPSGNCTFPAFNTMGICGKCQQVSVTEKCGTGDQALNCTLTTPSGVDLTYSSTERTYVPFDLVPFQSDYPSVKECCGIKEYLVGFASLQPKNVTQFVMDNPTSFSTDPDEYTFHNCFFYVCERTFEETTILDGTPSSPPLYSHDWPLYRTKWEDSHDVNNVMNWYSVDAKDLSTSIDTKEPPPGKHLKYGLCDVAIGMNLAFLLASSSDASIPRSEEVIDYILQSDNVPAAVQNISVFLTNAFIASNSTLNVGGSTFGLENHFRIHWQWLLLPSFIVLGSVVLLTFTIRKHRSSKKPLWKSSNLALALHDFYLHSTETADGSAIGNTQLRWEQAAASMRGSELERLGKQYEARVESGKPSGREILIGSGNVKDRVAIGQFVGEERQMLGNATLTENGLLRKRRRAGDVGASA